MNEVKKMEKEKLSIAIDELVRAVYTSDQKDIDRMFINFLETLEVYMNTGCLFDDGINEKLIALQQAYINKDYITMCDVLLYDIKEVNLS